MLKNSEKMNQVFFFGYILLGFIEVLAEYMGWREIKLISKPLLMPVLALLLIQRTTKNNFDFKNFLIASLFFSWLGDVALMFVGAQQIGSYYYAGNPNFFLAGLIFFLIAHVLYIIVFSKTTIQQKAILAQKPLLILPLLLYMVLLMAFVLPALISHPVNKAMTLPVVIYSTVIGAMVIAAANRYGRVAYPSFKMVLMGATLFMVSDSIIAINAFIYQNNMPLAGPAIMTTYITAQLLIVLGVIKQYEK